VGATYLFWNCGSACPTNTTGCTQVDIGTFSWAFCCPP
jgi:hypothetical protein